jgi:hypothetical protein
LDNFIVGKKPFHGPVLTNQRIYANLCSLRLETFHSALMLIFRVVGGLRKAAKIIEWHGRVRGKKTARRGISQAKGFR